MIIIQHMIFWDHKSSVDPMATVLRKPWRCWRSRRIWWPSWMSVSACELVCNYMVYKDDHVGM